MRSYNLLILLVTLLIIPLNSCSKKETKVTKATHKKQRSLASAKNIIEAINTRIVSITDKSQIAPNIQEVVKLADADPSNATLQLYKMTLSPLLKLEGIIWRFRKVVEESSFIHLTALSTITKAYHQAHMFGPHVKAGMDYLISPTSKYSQFGAISDAQNFVETEVLPELKMSSDKLSDMIASLSNDWRLEFDSYLITGYDQAKGISFISESARFKTVAKAHLNYVLSSFYRTQGLINYVVNYNVDDFPKVVEALMRKTALNNTALAKTLKHGLPQISSMKELSIILNSTKALSNKKKYQSFLTLRKDKAAAQINLLASMLNFQKAIEVESHALDQVLSATKQGDASSYIVNPTPLSLNKEHILKNLKEKNDLFTSGINKKVKTVTNSLTGKQVKVNIAALFTPYSDLKVFIPKKNNFNRDPRGYNVRLASGKSEFTWNYNYGKPVSFPDPTFAGFLPEARNENIYQIMREVKLIDSLRVFSKYLPVP
jgi:hypothetical protein